MFVLSVKLQLASQFTLTNLWQAVSTIYFIHFKYRRGIFYTIYSKVPKVPHHIMLLVLEKPAQLLHDKVCVESEAYVGNSGGPVTSFQRKYPTALRGRAGLLVRKEKFSSTAEEENKNWRKK